MFTGVLRLSRDEASVSLLCDYLERHVDLDGDDHGPMAFQLVDELCGDDERRWAHVSAGATTALRARLALWDEVVDEIEGHARSPQLRD